MNDLNKTSPIVVVKVIDELTLVLNKGSDDGISKDDSFLVYYVEQEDIKDPISGESLGKLEIVRGSGSVVHVQPKMCTIKSNRTESGGRIIRRSSSSTLRMIMGETVEYPESQAIPFDYPQVGDFAKPV